jgi:hypothetical protein
MIKPLSYKQGQGSSSGGKLHIPPPDKSLQYLLDRSMGGIQS